MFNSGDFVDIEKAHPTQIRVDGYQFDPQLWEVKLEDTAGPRIARLAWELDNGKIALSTLNINKKERPSKVSVVWTHKGAASKNVVNGESLPFIGFGRSGLILVINKLFKERVGLGILTPRERNILIGNLELFQNQHFVDFIKEEGSAELLAYVATQLNLKEGESVEHVVLERLAEKDNSEIKFIINRFLATKYIDKYPSLDWHKAVYALDNKNTNRKNARPHLKEKLLNAPADEAKRVLSHLVENTEDFRTLKLHLVETIDLEKAKEALFKGEAQPLTLPIQLFSEEIDFEKYELVIDQRYNDLTLVEKGTSEITSTPEEIFTILTERFLSKDYAKDLTLKQIVHFLNNLREVKVVNDSQMPSKVANSMAAALLPIMQEAKRKHYEELKQTRHLKAEAIVEFQEEMKVVNFLYMDVLGNASTETTNKLQEGWAYIEDLTLTRVANRNHIALGFMFQQVQLAFLQPRLLTREWLIGVKKELERTPDDPYQLKADEEHSEEFREIHEMVLKAVNSEHRAKIELNLLDPEIHAQLKNTTVRFKAEIAEQIEKGFQILGLKDVELKATEWLGMINEHGTDDPIETFNVIANLIKPLSDRVIKLRQLMGWIDDLQNQAQTIVQTAETEISEFETRAKELSDEALALEAEINRLKEEGKSGSNVVIPMRNFLSYLRINSEEKEKLEAKRDTLKTQLKEAKAQAKKLEDIATHLPTKEINEAYRIFSRLDEILSNGMDMEALKTNASSFREKFQRVKQQQEIITGVNAHFSNHENVAGALTEAADVLTEDREAIAAQKAQIIDNFKNNTDEIEELLVDLRRIAQSKNILGCAFDPNYTKNLRALNERILPKSEDNSATSSNKDEQKVNIGHMTVDYSANNFTNIAQTHDASALIRVFIQGVVPETLKDFSKMLGKNSSDFHTIWSLYLVAQREGSILNNQIY